MEGRLFAIVLSLLPAAHAGKSRFAFDTRTIMAVLLWAVLHDRPQAWACDRANWPDALRPRHLPDPSTLSRRKRRDDLLTRVRELVDSSANLLGPAEGDGILDSRPAVVGGASKDPTARAGRGVGGFARGYRAHTLSDMHGVVRGLEVRPMNVGDRIVARPLLAHAPAGIRRVFADGNYDSVPLHRIAAERGIRFYAPIRGGRVGRRKDPRRLRVLAVLGTRIGKLAMAGRDRIERDFGRMSNIACGFKGLPAWVRGMERVTLWINAKVLFYHVYLLAVRSDA